MDRAGIETHREELGRFLAGEEREFSFPVEAPLQERIEFIYRIIFPGLSRFAFYGRFILARIAQSIDYSPVKVFLYRMAGIRIGKGVFLSPDVLLDVHFPTLITIEDYAILGWGCRLFSHEFHKGRYRIGRIRIGRGAMIGAFSGVRGGITVGEEAEVPCNSVVTRDIPPGGARLPRETAMRKPGDG